MSTRSQIRIKGNEPVLIYRHSDGYPGSIEKDKMGVIPDIMPFCLAFIGSRGYDPEYMTACLAAYLKQWHCGEPDIDIDSDNGPSRYCIMKVNGIAIRTTGHGIDTGIHGDTAYLYEIDREGITCNEVIHHGKMKIKFHSRYEFKDYEMRDGKCVRAFEKLS